MFDEGTKVCLFFRLASHSLNGTCVILLIFATNLQLLESSTESLLSLCRDKFKLTFNSRTKINCDILEELLQNERLQTR